MENLMFCLNATGPIFLMMVFGLFLRKVGILDEDFANRMNKFVFKIPLPFLLFSDLAAVDFSRVWNIKFIVFCFVVTLISITISTLVSCLWRDKSIRGEFIQASYRSSAALLGIAFIQNIYGNAGMAPVMIIGSVPPVSYTHLRAHETDSYLVCRLLLEKKKRKWQPWRRSLPCRHPLRCPRPCVRSLHPS